MYPTLVVLMSAVMLGRPITRRAILALLLSYAGIAFVVGHDLAFAGDARALWIGIALCLSAPFPPTQQCGAYPRSNSVST